MRNVEDVSHMFFEATAFNQSLGKWKLEGIMNYDDYVYENEKYLVDQYAYYDSDVNDDGYIYPGDDDFLYSYNTGNRYRYTETREWQNTVDSIHDVNSIWFYYWYEYWRYFWQERWDS